MLRPCVDRLSSDWSSVSNWSEFCARICAVFVRLSSAVALAPLAGASVEVRVFRPLTAEVISSVCCA